jgi:hypothetical protein
MGRIRNFLNNFKKQASFKELAMRALLDPNDTTVKYVQKFGQNIDIDTAASEDIWSVGGNRSYLTSAEQLNIVSTSTNDTAAGTGAQQVIISGIDADYNEIFEFITMDGTTKVLTTNSYLDIFRIVVFTAGSLETNDGNITATSAGTTTLLAQATAGDSITQMSHYTIPAGYTGFIMTETFSVYQADGAGARQGEIDFFRKRSRQFCLGKSWS